MPRQGYKTITVTNETYAALSYMALDCQTTISKLLETITKKEGAES